MKAFPDAKNQIIRDAVSSSNKHTKVMRNLIRAILNYSQNVKAFSQIYKLWKSLRYRLNIPEEEVADYCEFVVRRESGTVLTFRFDQDGEGKGN